MSTVDVNHNYGSPGALRYITQGGAGVEAAIIRAWKKADFQAGKLDLAAGVTLTDADGNWMNPMPLEAGFTYVIQFFKQGLYGPDKVEVIV